MRLCFICIIVIFSTLFSCSTKPRIVVIESYKYGQRIDLDTLGIEKYPNKFEYYNLSGQSVFSVKVEDKKLLLFGLECDFIEEFVVKSNDKDYSVSRYLFDDALIIDEEMEILYSREYGILMEKGILFNAGYNRFFVNDNIDLIESIKSIDSKTTN